MWVSIILNALCSQGTVKAATRNIHMDLAVEVLRSLYDEERTGRCLFLLGIHVLTES